MMRFYPQISSGAIPSRLSTFGGHKDRQPKEHISVQWGGCVQNQGSEEYISYQPSRIAIDIVALECGGEGPPPSALRWTQSCARGVIQKSSPRTPPPKAFCTHHAPEDQRASRARLVRGDLEHSSNCIAESEIFREIKEEMRPNAQCWPSRVVVSGGRRPEEGHTHLASRGPTHEWECRRNQVRGRQWGQSPNSQVERLQQSPSFLQTSYSTTFTEKLNYCCNNEWSCSIRLLWLTTPICTCVTGTFIEAAPLYDRGPVWPDTLACSGACVFGHMLSVCRWVRTRALIAPVWRLPQFCTLYETNVVCQNGWRTRQNNKWRAPVCAETVAWSRPTWRLKQSGGSCTSAGPCVKRLARRLVPRICQRRCPLVTGDTRTQCFFAWHAQHTVSRSMAECCSGGGRRPSICGSHGAQLDVDKQSQSLGRRDSSVE